MNTNVGGQSQQTGTVSQSYTPLMGNLNSENTNNNKNENTIPLTNSSTNVLNSNMGWADSISPSF